ncbi:prepilin peptidase [Streptomyces tsukubensis]|uniref:Prepilin peptidase n=1 Tax=Streptomyces tsukubensis TaxID=83656 RepID=A0A1V4A8H6_9ACTN|nr:A24 family peptidase [Streptomyces tsukubensis]OON78403.1 prepilin peptidase [Streptomyces tsukubensis]QFR95164.1 prepilin peptidase [Streptomyces tsukubensis]
MTDSTDLFLVLCAALWGAATGAFLPRAAYRFAVGPDDPWRDTCPQGHAFTRAAGRSGRAEGRSARTTGSTGPATGIGRVTGWTGTATGWTGTATGWIGTATGWIGRARCGQCTPDMALHGPGAVRFSVATAAVCALLAAATGTRPELGVWLLLAPLAVLLVRTDFVVRRLPDVLTLPLAAAAALLLGVAALLPEHAGSWPTALLGGLALSAAYFVMFLISPDGMGFGDVKLALVLGVALGWYGWGTLFLGTFAGFLFGGLYGLGLVVLRGAGRRTAIPFGPFLLGGALVGLLIGAWAA